MSVCRCVPSWESLRSFRLRAHHYDLTVITDAPQVKLHRLVSEWQRRAGRGEAVNIEDVLRENGYFAATGQTTSIEVEE